MLYRNTLARLVKEGNLTFIAPNGETWQLGNGSPPNVTVRVTSDAALRKIITNPALATGEMYMAGELQIEQGSLADFVALAATNVEHILASQNHLVKATNPARRRILQYNSRLRSRRNVAHHYDLSNDFYRLFLDEDMQYSCAYFRHENDSLETAQLQKKIHIADKLNLKPGMNVLDIGCGWGGMAMTLAREYGVNVLGVTLSSEQLALATARVKAAGLGDRVRFELRDYRDLTEKFDRIVSVGMFEHVGVPHYRAFFAQIWRLLKDDGVALLHTIGRADGPGVTNAWIRKYIFPGGYSPALSEILPHVEKQGFYISDIEILRLHYAHTLKAWRERFLQHRPKVVAMFDERFARMWEFYLTGSEMAFRYQGHVNFQIQLIKRVSTTPITRDYMCGSVPPRPLEVP
ncbi:MAG: cyclopropane-fatty-acyl-phospholipid synthase family protein [Candidatus Symbiobacter sp.]|nr:cyclopropane-fatty-acyl-phospholipid synthase family protein [Candidatus Symbiobacter sp.]